MIFKIRFSFKVASITESTNWKWLKRKREDPNYRIFDNFYIQGENLGLGIKLGILPDINSFSNSSYKEVKKELLENWGWKKDDWCIEIGSIMGVYRDVDPIIVKEYKVNSYIPTRIDLCLVCQTEMYILVGGRKK